MHVRAMTAADYDGVRALWDGTPGIGLDAVDDAPEGFAKYLRRNPTTCFVAEADGAIIGVILSGHDGRRGYIYHMAVAPGARRGGVGEALLSAAVGALRAEGIRKVGLVAFAENAVGNAFWEKHGFVERKDLLYRNRFIVDIEK